MFGDRMWGTGSPGIKWVRDQLRRSLFFYDGQFFMKSLMPVNAKLETLILLGLRLFVQHTRARAWVTKAIIRGHYPRDTAPLKLD